MAADDHSSDLFRSKPELFRDSSPSDPGFTDFSAYFEDDEIEPIEDANLPIAEEPSNTDTMHPSEPLQDVQNIDNDGQDLPIENSEDGTSPLDPELGTVDTDTTPTPLQDTIQPIQNEPPSLNGSSPSVPNTNNGYDESSLIDFLSDDDEDMGLPSLDQEQVDTSIGDDIDDDHEDSLPALDDEDDVDDTWTDEPADSEEFALDPIENAPNESDEDDFEDEPEPYSLNDGSEDLPTTTPQWEDTSQWEKDNENNWGGDQHETHGPDKDSELYKNMQAGLEKDEETPKDDEEDPKQPDDNSEEDKKSLKDKAKDFLAALKSEIGDPEDDDKHDDNDDKHQDLVPSQQPHASGKPGNGVKSIKDILLFPFHFIMGVLSGASKALKIVLSLSGIFGVLLVIWLICNVAVAFMHVKSNDVLNDEGSVSISHVSYSNHSSTVQFSNESDMIAHVGGTAHVYTYAPSLGNLKSLVAPIETASCSIPSFDLDPKENKTVVSTCTGAVNGFWPRIKVTVDYH
jgi:hypothetical protein